MSTEPALIQCDECGRQFEGAGTCPHCEQDIAQEYESEINPAAGGDPLAILGNLFLFMALLPVMLFAWQWRDWCVAFAVVGVLCHVMNQMQKWGIGKE